MKPKAHWSETEIIWIKAALTLPPSEFFRACDDIAELSPHGRTVAAVVRRAMLIRREEAMVAPPPLVSEHRPSIQQLMGAGGIVRQRRVAEGVELCHRE